MSNRVVGHVAELFGLPFGATSNPTSQAVLHLLSTTRDSSLLCPTTRGPNGRRLLGRRSHRIGAFWRCYLPVPGGSSGYESRLRHSLWVGGEATSSSGAAGSGAYRKIRDRTGQRLRSGDMFGTGRFGRGLGLVTWMVLPEDNSWNLGT